MNEKNQTWVDNEFNGESMLDEEAGTNLGDLADVEARPEEHALDDHETEDEEEQEDLGQGEPSQLHIRNASWLGLPRHVFEEEEDKEK